MGTKAGTSKGKAIWQMSASAAFEDDGREQTTVPRLITQEHRPDLCEPCRKWGDCSGWFADPFVVFAAVSYLIAEQEGETSEDMDLEWNDHNAGFQLQGAEHLGR